ncbi:putative Ig domain-containing protein [Nocardioides convexus]|uniref:putative Ig domain-containing protein n=1 Tax=Nocardioides convexus TaxID=2712224 RepID=UPI002418295F|nr:putative Ig domain-containing protein [Nocardioides convexus]
MPAQTADPTCTTAGNTVTVTTPGNRTGTVGTATSLQLTGSSSGAGQTLTWSATGLPAGLSINASTGLVSGTPTTATTANVTVTAKDTTGASGSTRLHVDDQRWRHAVGQPAQEPGLRVRRRRLDRHQRPDHQQHRARRAHRHVEVCGSVATAPPRRRTSASRSPSRRARRRPR